MIVARRGLTITLVVILVAFLALGALVGWVVVRGFPQRSGSATLAGLGGAVEVVRDANGIPHVYADTAADLFMAQGWLHASERLWQMEVWRRIGAGRLSELFGSGQLETDAFIRTLGWRRAAERDFAALSTETRTYLQAYADGVNAYLDTHPDLPLPFVIAGALGAGGGLSGFRPEPWTPLDTVTWQKVQAWDLGANWEAELFRSLANDRVGKERIDELFPAYRDDRPVIVPCDLPGAGGAADGCEARPKPAASSGIPSASSVAVVDPGSIDIVGATRLRAIAAGMRGLSGLGSAHVGPIGANGLGSNSWALAPARSATGSAALANDPHLGVSMPSVWYLVGLHCRQTGAACPFDMAGAGFPGVPGLVLGHNDRIAWGLTNVGPDVQDLYIEAVDPADPSRYRTADGSATFVTRTETIGLGGGETATIEVRKTIHGPVISDVVNDLKPRDEGGGALGEPDMVMALQWTALTDEDHTIEAVLGVNQARDWTQFREALRSFGAPAQTFLFADVDGHIGVQVPGTYPIRRTGDGSAPVPGWDPAYGWLGRVPYDDLPWIFDPPSGVIVTANNAPVDADFPYFLGGQWDPGYRSARISELLGEVPRDADHLRIMQADTKLTRAAAVVAALGGATPTTDDGATVLERTSAWSQGDDPLACRTDSPGCAAYETFELALLRGLFDDELGGGANPGELASMYVGSDPSREALRAFLDDPTNAWWDDVTTPAALEDRDAIVTRALDTAGAWLRETLGDPDGWTWDRLHTVSFNEATLGESGIGLLEWVFDMGPYPASGSCDTLDARCSSFGAMYPNPYDDEPAAGTLTDAFAVSGHPSYRLLADMGDLDGSTIIQSTGQSGVPFDEHYGDWIDEWLAVEALPLPFSREAVDAAAQQTLILTP